LARCSKNTDSEILRARLLELIKLFDPGLQSKDLRKKVIALVPAYRTLKDLGSSLIPKEDASSAQDRIIFYLKFYSRQIVSGDELMVISGINEWARRVRELRVEFGWSIVTGVTLKEMIDSGDIDHTFLETKKPKNTDYILLNDTQDREAAFRWNKANKIRRKKAGVKDKLLEFLKLNIGHPVTGEELRYVANGRSEWARRIRELRTEDGWLVSTRTSGRPDLAIGTYVLENEDQLPPHDRKISDRVRGEVLFRDDYKCQTCGWNQSKWSVSNPRHLELHHITHHAKGGANSVKNLITLCTTCHREAHRS